MTLGRPATTPYKSAVPLPVAIDDEYLIPGAHGCVQPDNILARNSFFVQTLKLNQILGEVLFKVYNAWDEANENEDGLEERVGNQLVAVVVELDSKLAKFEKDLPEAFRWVEVDPEDLRPDSVIQLQRNVLALRFVFYPSFDAPAGDSLMSNRYFFIRSLLYRPMFISLCLADIPNPLSSKMTIDGGLEAGVDLLCSTACVEAAQRLIHLVYKTADALGTGGGAWWYNIYCMILVVLLGVQV